MMAPRREFFRASLRYAGLSALGLLAVAVTAKPNCSRTNPCGTCHLFSGCGLPKAREAKVPNRQSDRHDA